MGAPGDASSDSDDGSARRAAGTLLHLSDGPTPESCRSSADSSPSLTKMPSARTSPSSSCSSFGDLLTLLDGRLSVAGGAAGRRLSSSHSPFEAKAAAAGEEEGGVHPAFPMDDGGEALCFGASGRRLRLANIRMSLDQRLDDMTSTTNGGAGTGSGGSGASSGASSSSSSRTALTPTAAAAGLTLDQLLDRSALLFRPGGSQAWESAAVAAATAAAAAAVDAPSLAAWPWEAAATLSRSSTGGWSGSACDCSASLGGCASGALAEGACGCPFHGCRCVAAAAVAAVAAAALGMTRMRHARSAVDIAELSNQLSHQLSHQHRLGAFNREALQMRRPTTTCGRL